MYIIARTAEWHCCNFTQKGSEHRIGFGEKVDIIIVKCTENGKTLYREMVWIMHEHKRNALCHYPNFGIAQT